MKPFCDFAREISLKPLVPLALLILAVPDAHALTAAITYTDPANTGFYDPTPRSPVAGNAGTTLGEQRRNVFEAAVNRWCSLLEGSQPLQIQAVWVSQGSQLLASARPAGTSYNFNNAPVTGVAYPYALANQLAGTDLDTSSPDIFVNCNQDWDTGTNAPDLRTWYYGMDAAPPGDNFDFYGIMLHELAHGLGMSSDYSQDGSWLNGFPQIYDYFLADGSGQSVITMSQAVRAATGVSGNLFFVGSFATSQNGDAWPRINAPSPWLPASSIAHLDESTYSVPNGINEMQTPVSSFPTHNVGTIVPGIFEDLGWKFYDNDPGSAGTVSIVTPVANRFTNYLAAAGTAADWLNGSATGAIGLKEVHVALSRNSDGRYWNWDLNAFDSTIFSTASNRINASVSVVPINTGSLAWSSSLPNGVADGGYTVNVSVVDLFGHQSAYFAIPFTKDATAPTVALNSPADTIYQTAPMASGTAVETNGVGNSGVAEVHVVLYRTSDTVWWNFHDNTWGTTNFNAFYNIQPAAGTTSWTAALPASLADGGYRVQAQSVDAAGNASGWVPRNFTIDNTAPTITFSPLTNYDTVFNFDRLGGTVSKAATVHCKIEWFRAAGNLFWNGVNWTSVEDEPGVLFPATVAGLNWTPAPGTLPPRSQLAQADYVIYVYATDLAGNDGYSNIELARSAPDTTPPLVTLDNILNGDVLTNASLPGLSGFALDNESGIASVDVYLDRFTDSGVECWNGTNWSADSAALPASYDAQTVAWQVNAPLPGGTNLPNARYNVQVAAANNEVPPGVKDLSVNFTVDYHPVFVFTYGSQSGPTPTMSWNDPANWDAGAVPTSDALVIIDGYAPDSTASNVTVYRLDLSGGTLHTAGLSVRKLNLTGGSLTGGAIALATNGVFNWSGGTLAGAWTVPGGALLNISGANDKFLGVHSTMTLAGSVVWTGAGNINAANDSQINNTGTFGIQCDAQLVNDPGGVPSPGFDNKGVIQKTNSPGVTVISDANFGWHFSNSGTLDIESGALSSRAGLYLNNGTVFAGSGVTRVDAGYALLNGTMTVESGATFEMAGDVLDGRNVFTGPGRFVWSGGAIEGTTTIQPDANLSIEGFNPKTLDGTLVNAGHCIWSDAGPIYLGYAVVFENDGSFTAQNDAMVFNYSGGTPPPAFVNNGSFTKTNATGVTDFDSADGGVDFNNNGAVALGSGTLGLYAGYTTTSSNQLDISIGGPNAGTQFGTKDFGGAATFDGTLAIALTNGFTPTNGQSFTLANYTSRTGQFTSTLLPPLPPASQWKLIYDVTTLRLQVVPANQFTRPAFTTNGDFTFDFIGEAGSGCLIEASTNLVTWAPLLTNTPFNGSFNVTDPQTMRSPRRFFRGTILP